MGGDLNPVSKGIATIVVGAGVIWTIWCTWVAFVGGSLPLVGWELDGGIVFGLFWLFIVDPFVVTVAYWVSMLIALPLIALSELVSGDRTRSQ